jgi:hypothetical protein
MAVRINHSDDAQVYVNGALAYDGSSDAGGYRVVPAAADALATLMVGPNTIAVHATSSNYAARIDVQVGTHGWTE